VSKLTPYLLHEVWPLSPLVKAACLFVNDFDRSPVAEFVSPVIGTIFDHEIDTFAGEPATVIGYDY